MRGGSGGVQGGWLLKMTLLESGIGKRSMEGVDREEERVGGCGVEGPDTELDRVVRLVARASIRVISMSIS